MLSPWIPRGANPVFRTVGFFASHGPFTSAHVSALCGALPGRTLRQAVPLSRSVPRDGICTADLPRELARHRSLSARPAEQALPPGVALHTGSTQYLIQSQRTARLADVCRLCPRLDLHRSASLCRRGLGTEPQQYRLCPGCLHHRSVFVGLPVGAVSSH